MEKRRRLLCPTWHTVTEKEALSNWWYSFDLAALPDHGGVGVDVDVTNGHMDVHCPKSGKVESYFGAEKYALPLTSPVKVKLSEEPCMEKIKALQQRQDKFCTKLVTARGKKITKTFEENVKTAHEKVSALLDSGESGDVRIPKRIVELAEIYPDDFPAPRANWNYLGGSLDFIPTSDVDVTLLHPSGKKINKLSATRIHAQKSRSNRSRSLFRLDKRTSLKLSGGLVYQVDVQNSPDLCCVRKLKCCHIVSVQTDSSDLTLERLRSFASEEHLSSARLSPHIPGECLQTTTSGQIHLLSTESENYVWSSKGALWEGTRWSSDFSGGPRLISVLDRHKLTLADLRLKPHKPLSIFSASSHHLLPSDGLILTKRHPTKQLQCFLCTDHQLLLCDHRYPNRPVQIWNHMLQSPPVHCSTSVLRNGMEVLVLLGSQESRETCCFQLGIGDAVQTPALVPPWYLSSPADFGHALRLQGAPISLQRLPIPLTGACGVPHPSGGFTAIQVTSLGDLFYQDYYDKVPGGEKNYCFGPGCNLQPPQEIMTKIESWLVKKDDAPNAESEMPVTVTKKCSTLLRRILRSKPIASKCGICIRKEGRDVVKRKVCPSCGLHVDASRQLRKARHEGGVLCGKVPGFSENDNGESLRFTPPEALDRLSQKLLRVWTEEQPVKASDNIGGSEADVLRALLTPDEQSRNSEALEEDDVEMLYFTSASNRNDSLGF